MPTKTTEERKTGFAKVIEVARYLNVSKHTLYRAIEAGEIAHTKVGDSTVRILWEDVYALHKPAVRSPNRKLGKDRGRKAPRAKMHSGQDGRTFELTTSGR